jgi:hypothetical protein
MQYVWLDPKHTLQEFVFALHVCDRTGCDLSHACYGLVSVDQAQCT